MHWKRPRMLAIIGVAVAGLLDTGSGAAAQDICFQPLDPMPIGMTGRPADFFGSEDDYEHIHSSTHLQGSLALDKWAFGMYDPAPPEFAALSRFQTAVIVNNPDPLNPLFVDIEYRNRNGTFLGRNQARIAPEGTYSEQASLLSTAVNADGLGSIRVVSTNDVPFVGATIHHTYSIAGFDDPHPEHPGASSMQQLQRVQSSSTELHAGPFPISTTAPYTFLNRNMPTWQVVNPNNVVNVLQFTIWWGTAMINQTIVALPPGGSLMDLTLFNLVIPIYFGTTPFDADLRVQITSLNGQPVLGEALMMDFFGPPPQAAFLGRFRMTSYMLASTPSSVAVNPELTYQTQGPPVETLMGITNVSNVDIGPVSVEYRDRNGILAVDNIQSLAPGAAVRLQPNSPSYPAQVFDGTVRIVACKPGLVGWTARAVEEVVPNSPHFKKAYGELLDGLNGAEPGIGWDVTVQNQNLIRKVAPIDRVDPENSWPSYTTFANLANGAIGNNGGNVGPYFYRFYDFPGNDQTSYVFQPFAGVRFGDTSFTYEDGANNLTIANMQMNVSGRVDHTNATVHGIDAIGGRLDQWELDFDEYEPPAPIE